MVSKKLFKIEYSNGKSAFKTLEEFKRWWLINTINFGEYDSIKKLKRKGEVIIYPSSDFEYGATIVRVK